MSSNIDTILEVGNALVGYVQGIADISKNPSGVEHAAALHGLAGVLVSAIGTADTPFLKALTSGVRINLGANGIVLAGIQLSQSYSAYQTAVASGNATAIAAAQRDLADKTLGALGAVGATIATIPTPATKSVGLSIWFGATLGQQFYNGNAQRLLDIIGQQTSAVLQSIIGGPSVELWQHRTADSEAITTLFRDSMGIPKAELGGMNSGSKFSTIEVSVTDGWLVHVHQGTTYLGTYFRPNGPTVESTKLETFSVSQERFNSVLNGVMARPDGWWTGISDFTSNTVDRASAILDSLGIGTPIYQYLLGGTESQQYAFASWNMAVQFNNYLSGLPSDDLSFWTSEMSTFGDLGMSSGLEFAILVDTGKLMDPLVIDLNRDGRFASSSAQVVLYDLLGEGTKKAMTWLDSGDGFLAIDKNGNGLIDDGSELFVGQRVGESFELLAQYDANKDGIVDAEEAQSAGIVVWRDIDRNGVTNDDELLDFGSLGIQSISLANNMQGRAEAGGYVSHVSGVSYADGTAGVLADLFLGQAKSEPPRSSRQSVDLGAEALVQQMAAITSSTEGALMSWRKDAGLFNVTLGQLVAN